MAWDSNIESDNSNSNINNNSNSDNTSDSILPETAAPQNHFYLAVTSHPLFYHPNCIIINEEDNALEMTITKKVTRMMV